MGRDLLSSYISGETSSMFDFSNAKPQAFPGPSSIAGEESSVLVRVFCGREWAGEAFDAAGHKEDEGGEKALVVSLQVNGLKPRNAPELAPLQYIPRIFLVHNALSPRSKMHDTIVTIAQSVDINLPPVLAPPFLSLIRSFLPKSASALPSSRRYAPPASLPNVFRHKLARAKSFVLFYYFYFAFSTISRFVMIGFKRLAHFGVVEQYLRIVTSVSPFPRHLPYLESAPLDCTSGSVVH